MRSAAQKVLPAIAALACLLAWTSVASACPSCKAALASSGESGGNVVQGFFWSILFMMSMPFAILGGISSYFYLTIRRARRAEATPAAASDADSAAQA